VSSLQEEKHPEFQYLELLKEIYHTGDRQKNRTGIDSFMVPGAMMKFDLRKGFPAITTKKLAFGAVKGELLGFLRGYTSAADFRKLGCKIWDQNANENDAWLQNPARLGEDDLGYIYSRLWTDMPKKPVFLPDMGKWNQIDRLVQGILDDPTSRRLIVSAWHPEVFSKAALPPCHVLFQVLIDQTNRVMHMSMYQRSCDMFLGVPFNIASYALLLSLISYITGYTPGILTWFGADCHIYENHLPQVVQQLIRDPFPFPQLEILVSKEYLGLDLTKVEPADIQLVNYQSHAVIQASMAV
jgi:thymidylate synthase